VATYNCAPMPEKNHRESSGGVIRFGGYELDPRRGVLSRGGFPVKIQPQPLRVLELLVTRAPGVVTREELSDSVWGNGVNVDLEQSLNFCVRQIRSVLNDSASNPKFIDTLPKQGYRFIGDVEREAEQPAVAAVSASGKSESLYGGSEVGIAVSGAPGQRRRSKRLVWSSGVFALLTLATVAYLVVASRNSIPPLRVSTYTQITHDGHAKQLQGTDGSRLYFDRDQPQPTGLGQVAISGGAIAPVPVAVPGPTLVDVSPDGSTFLVKSLTGGGLQKAYPLWSVRILGGSARHLSEAVDAAWSPDGSTIAYSTGDGDIHLITSDGAEDRRLASVGSLVTSICWSPDGKFFRFTRGQALWEMSSNGSDLHRVLPAWWAGQDYGRWAKDGRFFFVSSGQI
jgi:DNA-binding winged helix-turn-helix (wHTH) protein